ncbi:tripartite tricarboxylate transporter substrate binding protein [Treponema sp. OMZ 840]|uniref:tripartite tricarboxylate transporter substrate binding protein n=1 Tax=Treponema sp. OMZ 840 TaxID=244313 RepID=UPI003D93AF35
MEKKLRILFGVFFMIVIVLGACSNKTKETTKLDWPKKSVQLVCGMSAGGDSDFNARTLAKYLKDEIGVVVVVTNITGAGGSIATEEVVNSPNDGYRFYMNHVPLHTAKAFGITEKGWSDLDPVCAFGQGTGEFVTVRSNFPANDIQGMIEETKKNPGKYRFGVNPGATSNYMAVVFQKAGAEFNLVSSGSAADRVVGLKGGHLDIILAGMPNVADYIKTGEFKVLGNCASQRHPTLSQYPTVKEQDVNGEFDPVYVLYAVKGTDPRIIEKMSKACENIVTKNKEYQEQISQAFSQVPLYKNTKETVEFLKKQEKIYMDISDELKASYKKK